LFLLIHYFIQAQTEVVFLYYKTLFVEVNVGTTFHYLGSWVLVIGDDFCLTSMNFCDSNPVVFFNLKKPTGLLSQKYKL
jgi:hypothetical protein